MTFAMSGRSWELWRKVREGYGHLEPPLQNNSQQRDKYKEISKTARKIKRKKNKLKVNNA